MVPQWTDAQDTMAFPRIARGCTLFSGEPALSTSAVFAARRPRKIAIIKPAARSPTITNGPLRRRRDE